MGGGKAPGLRALSGEKSLPEEELPKLRCALETSRRGKGSTIKEWSRRENILAKKEKSDTGGHKVSRKTLRNGLTEKETRRNPQTTQKKNIGGERTQLLEGGAGKKRIPLKLILAGEKNPVETGPLSKGRHAGRSWESSRAARKGKKKIPPVAERGEIKFPDKSRWGGSVINWRSLDHGASEKGLRRIRRKKKP